jgi:chemotaxis protein CheZ
MKPLTASAELKQQVKELDGALQVRMPSNEISSIVGSMLKTLGGDLSLGSVKMYQELVDLGRLIDAAKSEIAAVRPDQINDRDIPLATDELDAVVGATEEATGTILDACEAMENVAGGLEPEQRDKILASVTAIYEACNFQDVTGQRITKVVKTLQQIEARVGDLLVAFGDLAVHCEDAINPASTAEVEEPSDAKLLNGPQMPEDAKRQAEIDAILASFE